MQRLRKFNEHFDIIKNRRENVEKKEIDQMLSNAILFQKIKLTQQIQKLEQEKNELINQKNNDPYVKADQNTDTNPVLVEYIEKISYIESQIDLLKDKISKLE